MVDSRLAQNNWDDVFGAALRLRGGDGAADRTTREPIGARTRSAGERRRKPERRARHERRSGAISRDEPRASDEHTGDVVSAQERAAAVRAFGFARRRPVVAVRGPAGWCPEQRAFA